MYFRFPESKKYAESTINDCPDISIGINSMAAIIVCSFIFISTLLQYPTVFLQVHHCNRNQELLQLNIFLYPMVFVW